MLCAHLAEFGVIAPQGLRNFGKLIAIIRGVEDAPLPDMGREVLQGDWADRGSNSGSREATDGLAQEQPS